MPQLETPCGTKEQCAVQVCAVMLRYVTQGASTEKTGPLALSGDVSAFRASALKREIRDRAKTLVEVH
jgi:hypothetical protein